jgi:hypothetical protein
VNDCCTCAGFPTGTTPPSCPMENCFVPICESLLFPAPKAKCVAGRCVAGFNCNPETVQCPMPQPSCPPGRTPSVVNGCWAGCVPTIECGVVGSCEQCAAGEACVTLVGEGALGDHCVDVPAECNGTIDCGCTGSSACVKPFGFCTQPAPTQLDCECPNCLTPKGP